MNRKAVIAEEIEILTKAVVYVKAAFGQPLCKEFNPDCAACKGNQLIGYLDWYLDVLRWETNPKKELKVIKTQKLDSEGKRESKDF